MGRTSKKNENITVEEKTTTVIQEEQAEKGVSEEQATSTVSEEQTAQDADTSTQVSETSSKDVKDKEDIPPHVVRLMQLYSHYEEIWVTPRGFVHLVGAPQYLLKGAVLYKNKFYNK